MVNNPLPRRCPAVGKSVDRTVHFTGIRDGRRASQAKAMASCSARRPTVRDSSDVSHPDPPHLIPAQHTHEPCTCLHVAISNDAPQHGASLDHCAVEDPPSYPSALCERSVGSVGEGDIYHRYRPRTMLPPAHTSHMHITHALLCAHPCCAAAHRSELSVTDM